MKQDDFKIAIVGLGYVGLPLAVAHKEYLALDVRSFVETGVLFDVKGILPKEIIDSRL